VLNIKLQKKTLIKIAAKKIKNIDLTDEVIEGPVGIAFGYDDAVSLCKIISKISKAIKLKKKSFEMLGGVVDGVEVNKNIIEQLSAMLSRDELLAKFVGMIRSPLYSFSSSINSSLPSFARALKAYADNKKE
jgi:large subunit ribosomal protein L10